MKTVFIFPINRNCLTIYLIFIILYTIFFAHLFGDLVQTNHSYTKLTIVNHKKLKLDHNNQNLPELTQISQG